MLVVGHVGSEFGEQRAGSASGGLRVAVGIGALGRDGLRPEQVAGLLRHETDPVGGVDGARQRLAQTGEAGQQGRLAGAVAAHDRHDLAAVRSRGRRREGRALRRTPRPAPRPARPAPRRAGGAARPELRRRALRGAGPRRGGRRGPTAAAATIQPAGRARRSAVRPGCARARPRAHRSARPSRREQDDPVGVLDDPLEPVLGDQHGHARGRARAGSGRRGRRPRPADRAPTSARRARAPAGARSAPSRSRPAAARRLTATAAAGRVGRTSRAGQGSPRPDGASPTGATPSDSMPYASSSSTVSVTNPATGS